MFISIFRRYEHHFIGMLIGNFMWPKGLKSWTLCDVFLCIKGLSTYTF